MTSRAKITFVGPIVTDARAGVFSFLLVQGKGEALKLEYTTMAVAKKAREQVLAGPMTYRVTNSELLEGIRDALAQASTETKAADDVAQRQGA